MNNSSHHIGVLSRLNTHKAPPCSTGWAFCKCRWLLLPAPSHLLSNTCSHSDSVFTTARWLSLSLALSSDFSVWDWVNRIAQISPKNQELNKSRLWLWLSASLQLWNRNQRLLNAECDRQTTSALPPLEADGVIYLQGSRRDKENASTRGETCRSVDGKTAACGFIPP